MPKKPPTPKLNSMEDKLDLKLKQRIEELKNKNKHSTTLCYCNKETIHRSK